MSWICLTSPTRFVAARAHAAAATAAAAAAAAATAAAVYNTVATKFARIASAQFVRMCARVFTVARGAWWR